MNQLSKTTLWTAFLKEPTETEIQEAANKMKGGRAYMFKDSDGLLILRNKRRLNDYAAKFETFVKTIPVTA